MAYNALDVQTTVDECIRQLLLEQADLISARDYEGALEMAEINEFVEKYGYEPYDTDQIEGWRGDDRLAAIDQALKALRALNDAKV